MTEEEWFGSHDFPLLARYALDANPRGALRTGRIPKRKLRLMTCANVRSVLRVVGDERTRAAIELAEHYAEEEVPDSESIAIQHAIRVIDALFHPEETVSDIVTAAHFALGADPSVLLIAADAAWRVTSFNPDERQFQNAVLRDILGNPFRPVHFSPNWRTDTAELLARQIYESRDFSVMPILADALQDAGCDNDDILNHCRNPDQFHGRGCWVVDLVIGKS
jgi:hypothetical protein